MPSSQAFRSTLPWLVVLAAGVVVVHPLWLTPDLIFADGLSRDAIRAPWYFDFMARSLAHGQLPAQITDYDWPMPKDTWDHFPGFIEAALAVPLHWALPWPAQWRATQSAAVLVNGLGLALLARAVGARGLGVAVAGLLGLMLQPAWREMLLGRPHGAVPGLFAAAIAALLWTFPGEDDQRRPDPTWRVAAAITLVTLCVAFYPPFVGLFAPAALALLWRPLRRALRPGHRRALIAPAASLSLGVALAVPILLTGMLERAHKSMYVGDFVCPRAYASVALGDLLSWTPDPHPLTAAAVGVWLLVPAALLANRRLRGVAIALLALTGLYVLVSLSHCPFWAFPAELPGGGEECTPWPALRVLSRITPFISDFGRFANVALVLAALLAGLGAEALWRRGDHGHRTYRVAAAVLVALGLGHAAWWHMGWMLDPGRWHRAITPATALFQRDHDPGPVAELPWDQSVQYLSLLTDSRNPRVNPLLEADIRWRGDPFVSWLLDVGDGTPSAVHPTHAEIAASGVRWVFWDPARCMAANAPACTPDVQATIRAVLGPPHQTLDDGALVWDLTLIEP
jgi:hypothetical protein